MPLNLSAVAQPLQVVTKGVMFAKESVLDLNLGAYRIKLRCDVISPSDYFDKVQLLALWYHCSFAGWQGRGRRDYGGG